MPELPEVERARRHLSRWMGGGRIARASGWDRYVVRGRLAALVGRTVRAVGRRGKWLRIELDEGLVFAHLGMTGDFALERANGARLRWERARIDVVRAGAVRSIRYRDPRRFGRIVAAAADIAPWRALGPDPLLEGIDVERLVDISRRRRGPIKATLMDQRVLAGVGNILANEALFAARLDPRRPSRSLDAADLRRLSRALRAIIGRALKRDGQRLHVYGRSGEPCPSCRARLRSAAIAGRTTTFCPRCQR